MKGKNKKEEQKSSAETTLNDFTPPKLDLMLKLTKPLHDYFTPEFLGIEKLDAGKPALYIANHTLYGITDWTLLMAEVYLKKNIFIRTLSDNRHYTVPGWRELVQYFGMVRGTREHCSALMQQGAHLMVFPGGGREVFRRKNEKYSLQWKKRTGFAHMAIESGYDIVPIAQVGGDDAYNIIADAADFQNTLLGKLFAKAGFYDDEKKAEYIPPLATGLLGTPFPKPVKLYFSVGRRITTSQYKGDTNEENLWQVRNEAELEMTKELIKLLEYRSTDDSVSGIRKMLVKW
ncbi:MAG: lysophospholipid acyltransferase family protein [Chitinophagales bacterium]|nr:lysophospholipid acyltransferase family protein [Chitinophagales bacterium]